MLFTVIIFDNTSAKLIGTDVYEPQIPRLRFAPLGMTTEIMFFLADGQQLIAESEKRKAKGERRKAQRGLPHSHSIVPGGFDVMSYTTRLMPLTSFTIRLEMVFRTSCGRGTQSAVMPSSECTARMAQV